MSVRINNPTGQGSFTGGNGITITGTSIAIDTSVTVDKTTAQTLSNKTFVAPVLGAATYTTLSGGNITDSGLTAGRVTFAGTGGLLSDDSDLTFATDTLTVTKIKVNGQSTFTMTGGEKMDLQHEAGNFMRAYYGLAGNSVAVVFNRVESSSDFYFGETADTGGMIFRGSGASSFEGRLSVSSNGLTAETSGGGRALVGIGLAGATPTHALDIVNSYIDDGGNAYFDGKITSAGGYDPPYVLYDAHNRDETRGRVLYEVPIEKQTGAAQFWNVGTHQMEVYIASEDIFYDLFGNKLESPTTTKDESKKAFMQTEVARLTARQSLKNTDADNFRIDKLINEIEAITEASANGTTS